MKPTPRSPIQDWISIQEYKRPLAIFLAEWLAIFAIAWLFWWVMFFGGGGVLSPGLAATCVSGLYATCLIYGRLLRATGCKKCTSPIPFLRCEIGRRHVRDQEECFEVEYGGYEWGQSAVRVYCRTVRTDIVTYRCSRCGQAWEEKVELPSSGYKPAGHRDR